MHILTWLQGNVPYSTFSSNIAQNSSSLGYSFPKNLYKNYAYSASELVPKRYHNSFCSLTLTTHLKNYPNYSLPQIKHLKFKILPNLTNSLNYNQTNPIQAETSSNTEDFWQCKPRAKIIYKAMLIAKKKLDDIYNYTLELSHNSWLNSAGPVPQGMIAATFEVKLLKVCNRISSSKAFILRSSVVIARIPHSPSIKRLHDVSTPQPRGVTMPNPETKSSVYINTN